MPFACGQDCVCVSCWGENGGDGRPRSAAQRSASCQAGEASCAGTCGCTCRHQKQSDRVNHMCCTGHNERHHPGLACVHHHLLPSTWRTPRFTTVIHSPHSPPTHNTTHRDDLRVAVYLAKSVASLALDPHAVEVLPLGGGRTMLHVDATVTVSPKRSWLVPGTLLLPDIPIRATITLGVLSRSDGHGGGQACRGSKVGVRHVVRACLLVCGATDRPGMMFDMPASTSGVLDTAPARRHAIGLALDCDVRVQDWVLRETTHNTHNHALSACLTCHVSAAPDADLPHRRPMAQSALAP